MWPQSVLEKQITSLSPPRNFVQAIIDKFNTDKPAVIAEIKKASPSKGIIRENFDPVAIAKSYQQNGAACLSVLTDQRFFQGADHYLTQVRLHTALPILRKDFIIDAYQIYQSRILEADCTLIDRCCTNTAAIA